MSFLCLFGHKWENYKEIQSVSYAEMQIEVKECKRCGKKYEKSSPQIGWIRVE